MRYWEIFKDSFSDYWNYLVNEVSFGYGYKAWYENYFYWLIGLSLVIWLLEIVIPWRKKQPAFRKDFWLDAGYMFFNFFIFSLIAYNGISNVGVALFNDFLGLFYIENVVALKVGQLPKILHIALLFVVADFLQWNIHRLLHRVPWLWQFHKVHHSVKEMGFAAHLRFHWMEVIVYKSIQYIPLAMLGFNLLDFFLVHQFTLLIGHLNHSNLAWDYGPLKYLFNNPKMHLWHHAKSFPGKEGVNFGLSLSVWDYLFKTAYLPHNDPNIELGFPGEESFPKSFWGQIVFPFFKRKHKGEKSRLGEENAEESQS